MSQKRFKWSRSVRNALLRRKIFAKRRAAVFRAAYPILWSAAVVGLSAHIAVAGLVTSATLTMPTHAKPSVLTALPDGAAQTAALAGGTVSFRLNATGLMTSDTAPISDNVNGILSIAAAAGLPVPSDSLGFAGDTSSALGRPLGRHGGSVAMLAAFAMLCLGCFLAQWRADRLERRQLIAAFGLHDDALLFQHSGFGRWWRSADIVPARALGASWGWHDHDLQALSGRGRVVRRDRRSATLRSR